MTSAPPPTSGYDSYWECLTWQEYYQSCFSTFWDCFCCKVSEGCCLHCLETVRIFPLIWSTRSPERFPLFFLFVGRGIMPLTTYNCLLIFPFSLFVFFFWQSKVLLVLCSHLSSTREVSRALAGFLAPGDPRVLRCQGPQRQSPGPSAAPAIPTRTKSASTTATWISSGSTLLSKIHFYLVYGCPLSHAHILGLARHD